MVCKLSVGWFPASCLFFYLLVSLVSGLLVPPPASGTPLNSRIRKLGGQHGQPLVVDMLYE